MAKSTVKPVSFKKEELYLLEELEERYKPLSFSNYVKQLIMADLGVSKRHFIPKEDTPKVTTKDNYFIDEEREDIDL